MKKHQLLNMVLALMLTVAMTFTMTPASVYAQTEGENIIASETAIGVNEATQKTVSADSEASPETVSADSEVSSETVVADSEEIPETISVDADGNYSYAVHVEPDSNDLISEEGDISMTEEAAYASSGTQTTAETGLFGSDYTGMLAYFYKALSDCKPNKENNGVTVRYVYADGEDSETLQAEFKERYSEVLFGYEYDHFEDFLWATNEVGCGGFSFYSTYMVATLYYGVSSYYTDDIGAAAVSTIDTAVAGMTGTTRQAKVSEIYHWLIDNGSYDYDNVDADIKTENGFFAHSMLGILTRSKGVCESFAKSFKIFTDRLGIPCLYVVSDTHAFNYVLMDNGIWYMVDATFGEGCYGSDEYLLISNYPYVDYDHQPTNPSIYPLTSYSSYVDEGKHNYVQTACTEATCLVNGSITLTCTDCGDVKTGTIYATGHDYEEGEIEFSEDYSTYSVDYTCSKCDDIKTFTGDVTVTSRKDPTCTSSGTLKYSVTITVVLEELSANNTTITKTSTRTYSGTKILPALGHDYVVTNEVAPTCTASGTTTKKCSRCGNEQTTTTAALGHNYVDVSVVAPTCLATGTTTEKCSRCGNEQTVTTAALGHLWEVNDLVEPTCTTKGSKTERCVRCGLEEQYYTNALGHQWVDESVVAPTCTEQGYTVQKCSRDGCSAEQKVNYTAALGHNYVDVSVVAPTCLANGTTTQKCSRCDKVNTITTAALGHNYVDEKVVAPTCTEQGYTVQKCSHDGCDAERTTKQTSALGHNYERTVVKAPTATTEGEASYTCSRCGKSYTETIACLPAISKVTWISSGAVTNLSTGISLKWNKNTAAEGYYIYRGTGSGALVLVKTITKGSTVSWTDTKAVNNGTTYTYRIYAWKTVDGFTDVSPVSTTKTIYRITRPAISKLTNSAKGALKVTWAKNSKVTGYQVQYSTSSSFTSAKTVKITSYKTLTTTIRSLKKGKTYYVKLRGYKKSGTSTWYSAWSAYKKLKLTK